MERLPRIWIAAAGVAIAGTALTINSWTSRSRMSRAARPVVVQSTRHPAGAVDGQREKIAVPQIDDASPRVLANDLVDEAVPLERPTRPVILKGETETERKANALPSESLSEIAETQDDSRPELAAARAARAPMPSDNLQDPEPDPPKAPSHFEGITNPYVASRTEPAAEGDQPRRLKPPLPDIAFSGPVMMGIEAEAIEHIRHGLKLGDRQAFFAARTEFIAALRSLTRAFDAQAGLASNDEGSFGQSLAAGLRALEEIDDLMPHTGEVDADVDIASIVETHRTPVLKGAGNVNPINAVQRYLDYAVSELGRAGGTSRVASHALYGFGRAHMALRKDPTPAAQLHASKAMACQQAALRIAPDNYLASNELGVLYAEFRQYELAKGALLRSVSVSSQPTAWQNLAAVHTHLGEHDLAKLAMTERDIASDAQGLKATGHPLEDKLIWVSPDKFSGAISRAPAAAKTPPATAKQQQRNQARR
jgi:tetratricopeptide (TPR) repeat protein